MQKIFSFISGYFSNEIKWPYFILVFLFGSLCVFFQYRYDIQKIYLSSYHNDYSFFWRCFTFYAIPFIGTIFMYSIFYKKWNFWKNRAFLSLCLITIIIYVLRCKISFYTDWVRVFALPLHQQYWMVIAHQLAHGTILLVFPLLYWLIADKNQTGFYGWKFKGVSLKPYFLILFFLIPLMALACTSKGFLRYYPLVNNVVKTYAETNREIVTGALFELCYGFDFLMNEFFFRGFIVLAFAPFLGRAIILPMAMFYVFIHFGKPIGETISSFLGGLALGIIVYETRSIFGGVILHIGVAWMMELAAGIAKFSGFGFLFFFLSATL